MRWSAALRLLLLDEPLAKFLDIRSIAEVVELLRRLVREQNRRAAVRARINLLPPAMDRIIYLANAAVASGRTMKNATSKVLSELYEVTYDVIRAQGRRRWLPAKQVPGSDGGLLPIMTGARTAPLPGGGAALASAVAGVFTVIRGDAFPAMRRPMSASAGGSASFLSA